MEKEDDMDCATFMSLPPFPINPIVAPPPLPYSAITSGTTLVGGIQHVAEAVCRITFMKAIDTPKRNYWVVAKRARAPHRSSTKPCST